MDVHVDGYRSTSENWAYAHHVLSESLPEISPQQREVALALGISAEDYARSLYAGDLTRHELEDRARLVGGLVAQWLKLNHPGLEAINVWLKTFDGKFRLEVGTPGHTRILFLDEEMMDELLNAASPDAKSRFEQALRSNLVGFEETVAL